MTWLTLFLLFVHPFLVADFVLLLVILKKLNRRD